MKIFHDEIIFLRVGVSERVTQYTCSLLTYPPVERYTEETKTSEGGRIPV